MKKDHKKMHPESPKNNSTNLKKSTSNQPVSNVSRKNLLAELNPFQKLVSVMIIVGVVVTGFIIFLSMAATTPKSQSLPPVAVETCGKRVANYSYQRPFGDTFALNVPICTLPKWSRSDDMVNRLNNNAYITGYLGMKRIKPGDPAVPMTKLDFKMQFGLEEGSGNASDYSIPVYKASDATQQVRVRLNSAFATAGTNIGGNNWQDNSTYNWGATIPWNPKWRPAAGFDAMMVIIDEAKGVEIDLWGVSRTDIPSNANVSGCWGDINNHLFRGGYDANVDLCVATAYIQKAPDKSTIDYRTYAGNSPHSNGGGIQNYAGLITPEEVMAGEIRHATKFAVTNTMFGPECPKNIDINDPAIGKTCGLALAPAGHFEKISNTDGQDCNPVLNPGCLPFATGNTPEEKRAGTVPEGMRVGLNITDSEISQWLDSRGYTGRKRETARVLAVAMRDYGLIVTDSGGGGAIIQASGGRNTDTAQKWRDLGIEGDGNDLLFGLFTKDKMYVAEPATNTCADNTTTRYSCFAKQTGYPNVTPPSTPSSPPPTVTDPPSSPPPTTNGTVKPTNPPAPSSPPPTVTDPPPPTADTTKPTGPAWQGMSLGFDWLAGRYYMNISWPAASDNVGVTSYEVRRNGVVIGNTASRSLDDRNIQVDQPYSYQVFAIDAAGNKSSGSTAKTTTVRCFWIFCGLQ